MPVEEKPKRTKKAKTQSEAPPVTQSETTNNIHPPALNDSLPLKTIKSVKKVKETPSTTHESSIVELLERDPNKVVGKPKSNKKQKKTETNALNKTNNIEIESLTCENELTEETYSL